LVVAGGSAQRVEVWQQSGSKSFLRLAQVSVPAAASSVVIAEVSGDGIPDLVVALAGQKNIALIPGKGQGTFGSAISIPSGTTAQQLSTIDINCDGRTDIVTSSASENKLGLLLGSSAGLQNGQTIDLSSHQSGIAQALAVADVNFDGLPDLLVGGNQTPAYLLIPNISP
jgi:hypothetical protein